MLIVDKVPEVFCAACEHDSKSRILVTLVRYISKNYDHIDTDTLLKMLDLAAKATRDDESRGAA